MFSLVKRAIFNEIKLKSRSNLLRNTTLSKYNDNSKRLTSSHSQPTDVFFNALSESSSVQLAQTCLLNMHDITGLPWWATIVGTTVLLRTFITVPLTLHQSYVLAKLENIKQEMPLIVKELKQETAVAVKLYNWDEKTARITYNRSVRKQWNNLVVRENCHPLKASLLVLVQLPMWVCLSVAIRNLVYMAPKYDFDAQLTFTELTLGGFGWIPNLTIVDQSFLLPVSLGILNLLIIELQSLTKLHEPTKLQKYLKNFFRGISVLMVPVASTVPSCLVLYWTTSSAFGLVQNLILLSPRVRRLGGVPPSPSEVARPYQHLWNALQKKFSY